MSAKPQITQAEADQAISRASEALRSARIMIKGTRPQWDAAFDMLSVAMDQIRLVHGPILDQRIAAFSSDDN